MVKQEKAKQFQGFDIYDYQPVELGGPWGDLGYIVAGDGINFASALGAYSEIIPFTPGCASIPLTPDALESVGPQYPWPYEGQPDQFHSVPVNMPVNPAHVQRTTFRLVIPPKNGEAIMVYFFDQRLAMILSRWLQQNPEAADLGPVAGNWPLPVGVPLYNAVGNYTFERKWVWLFWRIIVPGNRARLGVYMWG